MSCQYSIHHVISHANFSPTSIPRRLQHIHCSEYVYPQRFKKMTQNPNSTELLRLPDAQQPPSPESNPALSPKSASVSNWRWREMISAAFIVVDFFFLYSTISLIGVFFPAEVCNSLILHYTNVFDS